MDSCRSCAGCLFRILAAILAVLFVATLLIVLVLLNADRMLLAPEIYQTALTDAHVYDQLPSLAAEQIYAQMHNTGSAGWAEGNPLQTAGKQSQDCAELSLGVTTYEDILSGARKPTPAETAAMQKCGVGDSGGGEGGPPEFFLALSESQWRSILAKLLPSEWLQSTTEKVLRDLFTVIGDPNAPVRVLIPMQEFKTRLTGPAGMDVLNEILSTLPPCPAGQIPSSSDPSALLQCRPPDDVLAQAQPQLQQALREAASGIPDEVDLLQPVRDSGMLSANAGGNLPAPPRRLLLYGRWIVRLSPLLCLGLLFLIALLAVRSWKGWLRWWGLPILSTGVAALLLAVGVWAGLSFSIPMARDNLPPNVAAGLFDMLVSIVQSVVRQFALALGLQSILLSVVGLGMLILSLFLPGRKPPAPAAPPPAAQPPERPGDETQSHGIFG
jgi:hypothetical protein